MGRLTALHQPGIRVIQPAQNRRNLLGDGCMEPADAGLLQDRGYSESRIRKILGANLLRVFADSWKSV